MQHELHPEIEPEIHPQFLFILSAFIVTYLDDLILVEFSENAVLLLELRFV